MKTKVIRINLNNITNLDKQVADECDNQLFGGFALVACFQTGDDLVLIFQSTKP